MLKVYSLLLKPLQQVVMDQVMLVDNRANAQEVEDLMLYGVAMLTSALCMERKVEYATS